MKFDFSKIDDFDRHINLSIPDYASLTDTFRHLALRYHDPALRLTDLGCSTGSFLHSLTDINQLCLYGVDSIKFDGMKNNFNFWLGDAEHYFHTHKNVNHGVIVSMFFLQFLTSTKREKVLSQIAHHVANGSTFLIAEKVYLPEVKLHQTISRLHIQNKRNNFNDKDILDKEKDMESSMHCKTSDELEEELWKLGKYYKVWQSYNFMGYIVTGE